MISIVIFTVAGGLLGIYFQKKYEAREKEKRMKMIEELEKEVDREQREKLEKLRQEENQ